MPEENTAIEPDDSHADVAAAFDKVEAAESSTATVEKTTVEADEPGGSPDEPVTPADVTAAGRARDVRGKFAKKEETAVKPTVEPGKPTVEPGKPAVEPGAPDPAQAQAKVIKAPASWKPEEKESWAKVPPAAQEAVMRREVEINRALAEASTSRRAVTTLQETISPYMQNIRGAGTDPVTAIKTFFDIDNRLRHGTQLEKAKALTNLIKGYGVDIAALDNALAGEEPSPEHAQQSAVQAAIAREMAPIREMMRRQQEQADRQQREQAQSLDQTIEQFASDPKNVYFDNVGDTMADLMEMAEKRGAPITLDQAYDSACWQTPEIRSILMRNSTAQTAGAGTQAAQRAKAAAVSVKSGPRSTVQSDAGDASRSRVDDVAAAFDKAMSAEQ